MRFTIVTPVFNGIRWLPQCVRSVDAQRAQVDVEHIVLDGGSTDGSREWLRQHATQAQLVFEPDDGQTDALARGLARATGDVLGWVNADDVLEDGALSTVATTFSNRPNAVLVSGAALQIDEEDHVTGAIATPITESLEGLLSCPTNLAQPSTFFRSDAYRRVGGLDRSVSLAMDVALWLALARQGQIAFLPSRVLSRFRIQAGARSVVDAGGTAREDLRLRLRAGMKLLSPAGIALVRYGFVHPMLAPLWRPVRDAVRRAVAPRSLP